MTEQGQGPATEFKQRGIQAAITMSAIVAAKNQFPYWHVDMHAGCGWNSRARCIGSPLAFLGAVRRVGKQHFQAHFCDKNEEAIWQLESLINELAIDPDNRCLCFAGDNEEILSVVRRRIAQSEKPQYAMGSVLCDPNGYSGSIPWGQLAEFSADHPRMDLILNLNMRSFKMEFANKVRGRMGWADRLVPRIDDFPQLLHRNHWLIRNVISGRGARFVLLVGRNFKMNEHRAMGFHHLDSESGRQIIDGIENGKSYQAEDIQTSLWDVPRISETPRIQVDS